ncbi:MAG: calcium/sodium antiporter [Microgenomates group bacterium]
MVILSIFGLIITFYLLAVVCEEFFVSSLDKISVHLKLNSDMAGATLMAIGSSAPEFFTSLIAVFRDGGGHSDVGTGTIVGSAIFNILVIIGASAAYKSAKLNWQPVVRDTAFYSLTIVLLLISFWDGVIVLNEAIYFVILYGVYIFAVAKWRYWFPYDDSDPVEMLQEATEKSKLARYSKQLLSLVIPDPVRYPKKYIKTFLLSIAAIAVLSYIMVESAIGLAEILHIHPAIIGLTVLAAGTSVSDLISSLVVAKQGRGDMAVSNAVGSNVFDILIGLGLPWMLVILIRGGSVGVANENLLSSVFLLFATVLAVFFILIVKNWTIGKRAGLFLIGIYVLYLGWNVLQVL